MVVPMGGFEDGWLHLCNGPTDCHRTVAWRGRCTWTHVASLATGRFPRLVRIADGAMSLAGVGILVGVL